MQAVIVAFRGSEPTNLINLRSAGRISMTPRRGLGRVHDGFFGALFFTGDEEAGTLFSRLIETIQAVDPENCKQLYLTGNACCGLAPDPRFALPCGLAVCCLKTALPG